jgi:hypothetical protein
MSQRDYNRQVVKRQRIRKATLIIEVDIGKAFNAAGFMDKEGKTCTFFLNGKINSSALHV